MYPTQRLNNLMREVLRDHPLNAGECILPPGHEELRRQIAKRMALAGAPTDPAHVVITERHDGCDHAGAARAVQPGDTVLVESPTYFGLLQAIEHLQSESRRSAESARSAGIDVDAVRAVRAQHAARRGRADAELQQSVRQPHARRRRSARSSQILTGSDVPIIEDDIYGDLHYGSTRPTSMRAFDDSGLVISCGSVSKTIAFGYRIGWAVSPQFHAEIARAKFYSSVACPTLQQLVLARYYASGGYDRYLRRVRSTLALQLAAARSMPSRVTSRRARASRGRRAVSFCGSSCRATSMARSCSEPRSRAASVSRPASCSRPRPTIATTSD